MQWYFILVWHGYVMRPILWALAISKFLVPFMLSRQFLQSLTNDNKFLIRFQNGPKKNLDLKHISISKLLQYSNWFHLGFSCYYQKGVITSVISLSCQGVYFHE